jgi:hypothetical protein
MDGKTIRLQEYRTLRTDSWWTAPFLTAAALIGFVVYAAWAAAEGSHYYVAPYMSPFYSPCVSSSCSHASVPLIGASWNLSPAFLVLWVPLGLRATCYVYRKAYYRSLFFSPPACAVGDASKGYSGESGFPLVLQNLHRYFFYLSLPVLGFVWWDALLAFRFPQGFGIGLGTAVLFINAVLLSLFAVSCNSCRHICGGHVKSLHDAPVRHRAWSYISRLNERHSQFAWISLAWVAFADFYIRLLAVGAIVDFRIL